MNPPKNPPNSASTTPSTSLAGNLVSTQPSSVPINMTISAPITVAVNPPIISPVKLPIQPARPIQRPLAPRVPGEGAPRQPGLTTLVARTVQMPVARQLPPNALPLQAANVMRGTFFVKTEDGQLQVLNMPGAVQAIPSVGQEAFRLPCQPGPRVIRCPQQPQQQQQMLLQQGAPRLAATQQVAQRPPALAMAPPAIVCISQSQVMPPPPQVAPLPPPVSGPVKIACAPAGVRQPQQLPVQTGGVPPAASGSLMTSNTAKRKCKNFLSTLLRLASDQPEQTTKNVKSLIQGLIDGAISPEDFTEQLEKELHSAPQPCLVPFLRKSLPYLRHSLMTKELSIEGVRPPSHAPLPLPPAVATVARGLPTGTAARALLPRSAAAQLQMMPPLAAAQLGGAVNLQGLLVQQQRFTAAVRQTPGAQGAPKSLVIPKPPIFTSGLTPGVLPFNVTASPAATVTIKTTAPTAGSGSSGSGKEKRTVGSLGMDDDINDVAAMGGVDITEESKKSILPDVAEHVEVRSCKDENFLLTAPLQRKIDAIAARHGISEVPDDVVALVSHATQERLKTLAEKLSVIAEHRQENLRDVARCEATGDVRQQMRFLEALDKLEKQRHDEEEREMIMRAARSRSRGDDAEQLKLKQRARDLQRAEMEELRQREANVTALMALGPRKKLKTEAGTVHTPIVLRPRPKRVNARDLLFLLEQEKSPFNSDFLYKAYMKY